MLYTSQYHTPPLTLKNHIGNCIIGYIYMEKTFKYVPSTHQHILCAKGSTFKPECVSNKIIFIT